MDVERYRQSLLEMLREVDERLGREVETARDVSDDQPAASDVALVEEARSGYLTVADSDTAVRKQIVAALIRIENGTFGRCVVDGEPIDEKRLDAVPWTPYCLKHQQEIEAAAGMRTPSL